MAKSELVTIRRMAPAPSKLDPHPVRSTAGNASHRLVPIVHELVAAEILDNGM
jgi:hypothetical protein